MPQSFSGSYHPSDVTFLLKPIHMAPTETMEKERRIQSGQSHYSEMISEEKLPSSRYLEVFHQAFSRNLGRFAENVCELAKIIAEQRSGDITLVSLARAGTPVGVLLKRVLERYCNRKASHYSISIIRDRGIDQNALLYILEHEKRPADSIVFVDGWTGKGVITRELKKALREFQKAYGYALSDALYVLSDLCGEADVSPSCQDYLIPSSILNATISGLISRSILNTKHIGEKDFHGCVYYESFADHDLSRWFVDKTCEKIESLDKQTPISHRQACPLSAEERHRLKHQSEAFLRQIMGEQDIRNVNYVKPGIGEATRVLLRRAPDKLLVRDPTLEDVKHLLVLAKEKRVPVQLVPELPYNAVALIQRLAL